MIPNLKRRFEAQAHPVGTWVSVGHPTVAEVTARVGFDFVLVDTEHTTISLETVEEMVRAVDAAPGDTDVVVRVPWNDHVEIKRILDIGVGGLMVPMVSSRADAEAIVEAIRYPPEGIRGIASGRAADYGQQFEEYVRDVDDAILTIVQIETEEGVTNVDDIAAVDGIDSLFVGPADLSGSLDVFGNLDADVFTEAVESVIDAGTTHGMPVGTLTLDPEAVESRLEQGFDYLIVGKDTSTLAAADEEFLSTYEQAVEGVVETPTSGG